MGRTSEEEARAVGRHPVGPVEEVGLGWVVLWGRRERHPGDAEDAVVSWTRAGSGCGRGAPHSRL